MNKKNFIKILQNPENLTAEELSFLDEINREFPYFQISKAIYLKTLKENDDIKFKKFLRSTAAYSRDRKILFDFINKSQNQNEKVYFNKNEITTVQSEYKIIEEDFDIIDTTQHPNHSPHFLQGTRMIGDKRTYIDFYLFDSEINKTNIIDRWNFWGRWEEPDYHLMIPKSLIYPIKKKTFEFGTCGIPAQEVETVKYLYGERWMHPTDKGKQYTTIMKNGRPYVVYL